MRTGRGIPRRHDRGERASRFIDDGAALTPARDGRGVGERAKRRQARTAQATRGAGVLEAPEIVFTPRPGLSKKEREDKMAELRATGARVRIEEPIIEPPAQPSVPNPLTGHDEIASASIEGNYVKITVHGPLAEDDIERDKQVRALDAIGQAIAKHHGSTASEVEVTVIGPRA